MAIGAISVNLIKPNFNSSFSGGPMSSSAAGASVGVLAAVVSASATAVSKKDVYQCR